MKIEIQDRKIVTSASISITLSTEREIQAFKNLLSWAQSGLFSYAKGIPHCKEEHDILTELQKITRL